MIKSNYIWGFTGGEIIKNKTLNSIKYSNNERSKNIKFIPFDAKNFFITNRIKNVNIGQCCVICNCSQVLNIKNKDISALAIPVEFI